MAISTTDIEIVLTTLRGGKTCQSVTFSFLITERGVQGLMFSCVIIDVDGIISMWDERGFDCWYKQVIRALWVELRTVGNRIQFLSVRSNWVGEEF